MDETSGHERRLHELADAALNEAKKISTSVRFAVIVISEAGDHYVATNTNAKVAAAKLRAMADKLERK